MRDLLFPHVPDQLLESREGINGTANLLGHRGKDNTMRLLTRLTVFVGVWGPLLRETVNRGSPWRRRSSRKLPYGGEVGGGPAVDDSAAAAPLTSVAREQDAT